MSTVAFEQARARQVITGSLSRINGQLSPSQNPQIVIGYRSGPSMIDFARNPGGDVGHVEIGIRENGRVTWFGFSPIDENAGAVATAFGTPGQFKIEGRGGLTNFITPPASLEDTATMLRAMLKQVDAGEQRYAFITPYSASDCVSIVEIITQSVGISTFDLVLRDGISGPIMNDILKTKNNPYQINRGYGNILKDIFAPSARCFLRGTLVSVPSGSCPIENIRVGDFVFAFDPQAFEGRGTLAPRRVTRVFRNITNEIISLDGVMITPGHHVLTENAGFLPVAEALASGERLIDIDGHPTSPRVERFRLGQPGAPDFEIATDIVAMTEYGLALAPQWKTGWRTYNFEVEDLHTYIAGGIRVHNTSIIDFIPDDAVKIFDPIDTDGDGKTDTISYERKNGIEETIHGKDVTGDTNTDLVDRTVKVPREGLFGAMDRIVWQERYEGGKLVPVEKKIVDVEYARGSLQGEEIGRTLGSVLGNAIGTDNVFAQVGSATIAATLLQNVSEFLHRNIDMSLLALQGAPVSPLEAAITSTFQDLGNDLTGNLKIQVNNALSSILIGELADVLNLQGFERGLFSTVGNTVTNQILNNISIMAGPPSVVQANTNLFSGFEYSNMLTNVANSLGGYFGSQLGNLAVKPKSPQSALFGSAAAAVGSYVATAAGLAFMTVPLVGPLIAAFAGQALGNLVGNALFDDDRLAHYTLFTDANGTVQYGYPYTQDGASLVLSDYMARTARDAINSLYGDASAHIDPSHAFNPFSMGWYVNNHNQKVMFTLSGGQQTYFDLNEAQGLIAASVEQAVANSEITGGDLLTRRAYAVSHKAGLAQLAFDLQVAKDFRKYLDNTRTINTLIADSPESEFSAGWIATLQRARELGLDRLATFNAMEYLATYGDLQQGYGTDAAGAERHMLEHGIAEGRHVSFDAYQYLAANPGLAQALGGIDRTTAARHYIAYGRAEGRPTRFDDLQYVAANDDLARWLGANQPEAAMRHYILHGYQEGRATQFDVRQYLMANPDLKETLGIDDATAAARHYVETGRLEGRSTHHDTFAYLASHPDLWAAFGTNFEALYEHALTYGIRPTTFDAAAYLAANADLRGGYGSNLEGVAEHYVRYGRNEASRTALFHGGSDGRTVVGGAGSDTVSYAAASSAGVFVDLTNHGSWNGTGYDALISIENVIGSRFDDTLAGDGGDNVLEGNGGTDTLYGNGGTDTISFARSDVGVIVDFWNHATWDGRTNNVFYDIENAIGSRFDDTIVGDGGDNVLDGNGGSDALYGSSGRDTFVFRSLSGRTRIMDFSSGAGPNGEVLRIARGLFANDDPLAAAADVDGNVVLTAHDQSTITLVGVQKSSLSLSNIQMV